MRPASSKPNLRRLVLPADYTSWEGFPNLYRLPWCQEWCPGNPTDDPIEGAQQFNTWQLSNLSANAPAVYARREQLLQIVDWCLSTTDRHAARQLAQLILDARKGPDKKIIPLELNLSLFEGVGREYRRVLAFCNGHISAIPTAKVFALQTILME